jgi:hypothetical protein
MFWNANGVLKDQYLLPEFLGEHRIDRALMNRTNLQPTKKWIIPAHTIHRTEEHRPQHGGTALAVKHLENGFVTVR